jgi:hypothetical protein
MVCDSSRATQDSRRSSSRRPSDSILAFPSMVAPRPSAPRSLGTLTPATRVCAPFARRPRGAVRTFHHPPSRPGLRRDEWLENWHADFAHAQLGALPDDFPGKQMAIQLLLAGRRPCTWNNNNYSGKLQRWFNFCTRVQQPQGRPPISSSSNRAGLLRVQQQQGRPPISPFPPTGQASYFRSNIAGLSYFPISRPPCPLARLPRVFAPRGLRGCWQLTAVSFSHQLVARGFGSRQAGHRTLHHTDSPGIWRVAT